MPRNYGSASVFTDASVTRRMGPPRTSSSRSEASWPTSASTHWRSPQRFQRVSEQDARLARWLTKVTDEEEQGSQGSGGRCTRSCVALGQGSLSPHSLERPESAFRQSTSSPCSLTLPWHRTAAPCGSLAARRSPESGPCGKARDQWPRAYLDLAFGSRPPVRCERRAEPHAHSHVRIPVRTIRG